MILTESSGPAVRHTHVLTGRAAGKGRFAMMKLILLVCLFLPACAPVSTSQPPAAPRARNLVCRIATRAVGENPQLRVFVDVELDPSSADPADYTIKADIPGGRELGASVRQVIVKMPRDRFNVAMTLDGRTHLRVNHIDLDIYIETVIERQVYILHCFREDE